MLKKFIESMRQSGTTTALAKIAKETGGYIVVSSEDMRNHLLKTYPELTGQVFTCFQVTKGIIELPKKPVFFDTDAVWHLTKGELLDSYATEQVDIYATDGYEGEKVKGHQLNIKLTDDDKKKITEINKDFFENEASNSMLGRILIRKGISFYKKLKV